MEALRLAGGQSVSPPEEGLDLEQRMNRIVAKRSAFQVGKCVNRQTLICHSHCASIILIVRQCGRTVSE